MTVPLLLRFHIPTTCSRAKLEIKIKLNLKQTRLLGLSCVNRLDYKKKEVFFATMLAVVCIWFLKVRSSVTVSVFICPEKSLSDCFSSLPCSICNTQNVRRMPIFHCVSPLQFWPSRLRKREKIQKDENLMLQKRTDPGPRERPRALPRGRTITLSPEKHGVHNQGRTTKNKTNKLAAMVMIQWHESNEHVHACKLHYMW